ncbi:MAG: DUF805 domain-containing protein [Brevundimonas sp.]|uniref:DUF805 domain-containing protein n=1 Tax=Brevundimonas sp. TaxID=1871086 RepID=UPI00391B2788
MFAVVQFLFGLDGRLRRKHFISYWLVLLAFALTMALLWRLVLTWEASAAFSDLARAVAIMSGALVLAGVAAGLALNVRRLHDMNQSGWWAALSIIPGLNIIVLLMLASVPGTNGPNRYGLDPRMVHEAYVAPELSSV